MAVLAAAGIIYAFHGSPPAPKRPGKPTLAATFTVPGDGTVDTVWLSPDGKLMAASGQGSSIYIWDTANPARVTTLTAPNVTVGKSVYSPVIDNVAFSADDASVTAVEYPNVPSGAPTPNYEASYAVYRWVLGSDQRTTIWSMSTPASVAFSEDDGTALTSDNNVVSRLTLSPALATAPPVILPGGADQSYVPPFELDLDGNRMIYHPTSDTTYVWDFTAEKVIAKLRSSAYTVLSPDGKTILAAHPAAGGTSGGAAPTLWDVAAHTNVTPADPRWEQQQRLSWQTYAWETFSTDGSVIATRRPGGNTDLWSSATHKYLLTITDPKYRTDGYELVGPGGSEVVILTSEKTVNNQDEYRQLSLWETPLG